MATAAAFLILLQQVLNFAILDAELWGRYVFGDRGPGPLFRGLVGTLLYTALVIPLGLAVGFFWAFLRISRRRVLSWPAGVLIEFFRGVPPLVLIIFAFLFGSALLPRVFGIRQPGLLSAALALAFHTAAYQAEIFRAGFQSVPRGQSEAALALGLTHGQTVGFVVLPQALRLSLPPLGNEFATVIKDTSLLAAVGAFELFASGADFLGQQDVLGRIDWALAVWTIVAAAYFLITFAVTRGTAAMERRLRVPGMEGAGA